MATLHSINEQTIVGTVKDIFRYPVKSLGGESLSECSIDDTGVVGDHLWVLVDLEAGKIANAKNPRKWGHLLTYSARYTEEPRTGEAAAPIVITLPDGRDVSSSQSNIDDVLSASLGAPVHLTTADRASSTKSEMVWLEDIQGSNNVIDRATRNSTGELQVDLDLPVAEGRAYDLGELHILTTSSLEFMSEKNPAATFDVRRFRPQLLIDTAEEGLVEAGWVGRRIQIGETFAEVYMNTVRCIMTTLARDELPLDRATMRTLVKHNTMVVEPFGAWACLGVYARPARTGLVHVGATVTLEYGDDR